MSRIVAGSASLIVAIIVVVGCQPSSKPTANGVVRPAPESDEPHLYEDVTSKTGIDFTYRNGEESGHYSILESLGSGVALIDYDRDGRLDIFLTGGGYYDGPEKTEIKGHPSRLYRNLGDWKFQDVTKEAGLDGPLFYTHGAAVADYDADGWPDLLVTGYGRVILYHNEPGPNNSRRFRDVTAEAGLLDGQHFWSTSAAFGDLDGDGMPELYVCQYVNWSFQNNPKCNGYTSNVVRDVCPPKQFDSQSHRLYQNMGKGKDGKVTFKDVSASAGLRIPPRDDKDYGKGLGVVMVDLNGDGKPEIYVANDTTDNFLYLNESKPGELHFKEVGFDCLVSRDGSGTPNGSMGVDAADYEGTGLPSLWVANYEGELHALYRNVSKDGRMAFRYSTHVAGIAAIGQNYVGFGTAFLDVDQDGWEDLIVINGHVIRHPYRAGLKQKPVLLRNLGTGKFAEITNRGGTFFQSEHRGRGLAIGDLDNDGRPDLVVSKVNEPTTILRHRGGIAHWIGLSLSRPDHRDAVGTRITIETTDRKLVRFAKGGGSYLSAHAPQMNIGLGKENKVRRLSIEWPAGEPRRQVFEDVPVDRYFQLTQGQLLR